MFKVAAVFVFTFLYQGACIDNQCNTSIVDVISNTPELSTLNLVMIERNLIKNFSDPELAATFLAPNNNAFNILVEQFLSTVEQLAADPLTSEVIRFHVIPNEVLFSEDFFNGQWLQSAFQGQHIIVDLSPGITFKPSLGPGFNDAMVVGRDIEACESVVHIVSSVLIPDFSNF